MDTVNIIIFSLISGHSQYYNEFSQTQKPELKEMALELPLRFCNHKYTLQTKFENLFLICKIGKSLAGI